MELAGGCSACLHYRKEIVLRPRRLYDSTVTPIFELTTTREATQFFSNGPEYVLAEVVSPAIR